MGGHWDAGWCLGTGEFQEGREGVWVQVSFSQPVDWGFLLIYSGVQRPLPVDSSFQQRGFPHQEDCDEQADPISAPADAQLGIGEMGVVHSHVLGMCSLLVHVNVQYKLCIMYM